MTDQPDKFEELRHMFEELRQHIDKWATAMSGAIIRLQRRTMIRFARVNEALEIQKQAIEQNGSAIQDLAAAVENLQSATRKLEQSHASLAESNASLQRTMLRQSADFDQELARMAEDTDQFRSNVATVFGAVFTKLDPVDELREQNKDILRRLEAVEKKLAS